MRSGVDEIAGSPVAVGAAMGVDGGIGVNSF